LFNLEHDGQDAEIRRDGTLVAKAKGLVTERNDSASFLPGTDIKSGDEVHFPLSEKCFVIEWIEKEVAGNELISVRAHFAESQHQSQQPVAHKSVVVHGQYIEGGSFHNSPIQVNSPNGVQNLTIGPEQKEAVRDAVRVVLEILNDLNLTDEDKD